MWPETIYKATR